MVKLQKKGEQYTITIPKSYINEKGWEKGEELVIGYDMNGNLIIKEVRKRE